jgi:hypothetical protein
MGDDKWQGPKVCISCGRINCLKSVQCVTPASPFPAELVERVRAQVLGPGAAEAALSVVAEWLRSDEVRKRVIRALEQTDTFDSMHTMADAVLAAVLEGAK